MITSSRLRACLQFFLLCLPGVQSNGWVPAESNSSLAGSNASHVALCKPAAAQQPASTSGTASVDSSDLQALIRESVNHPQSTSANGQQAGTPSESAAASIASAGTTPHASDAEANTHAALHLDEQAAGMYTVPEAVQAWATSGAAPLALDAPHSNAYFSQRSHKPGSWHVNGYGSSASEAYQGQRNGLHHNWRLVDDSVYSQNRQHQQDPNPRHPPGLSWGTHPHGSGTPQLSATRDHASTASVALPTYAVPPHATHFQSQQSRMHQQQQQQGGKPLGRRPGGRPNAELTSSLQSLDLAHGSWQGHRAGQSQHPSGQRWGRDGRPSGHEGGSATQPSSARTSPERSRVGTPQHSSAASTSAVYRPSRATASRLRMYPGPATGAYAEQEPAFDPAPHQQHGAAQDQAAARLPYEAAEAAMLASSAAADQHRPALADWPTPAPVPGRHLAAATDIERLLHQFTPCMSGGGQEGADLTLVRLARFRHLHVHSFGQQSNQADVCTGIDMSSLTAIIYPFVCLPFANRLHCLHTQLCILCIKKARPVGLFEHQQLPLSLLRGSAKAQQRICICLPYS